jgi:hypothetical protein
MTKTCSKCKIDKNYSDFYYQRGKPKVWCKICDNAASSAYLKSKKGKESRKRCDIKNTESRAIGKKRYYSSVIGKIARRQEITKGLSAAGLSVQRAIKNGIIFRKNICASCFSQAPLTHFHHLKGYNKENHLDVVELCVSCHREAHAEPDHEFHPRVGTL